jgi:hypothetical protein
MTTWTRRLAAAAVLAVAGCSRPPEEKPPAGRDPVADAAVDLAVERVVDHLDDGRPVARPAAKPGLRPTTPAPKPIAMRGVRAGRLLALEIGAHALSEWTRQREDALSGSAEVFTR